MSWETAGGYRVVVLAGGESAEREVSLASGEQALQALQAAGHSAVHVDPAAIDLATVAWGQFDVAFLALHGGAGEDGRMQRRLELLHVPYTGSGPAASRLAMSKSASKERFFQAEVPTLPYVLFHAADPRDQIVAKVANLGYPLAIKPDGQGSSLGVAFASSEIELPECIEAACRYEPFVLAEPRVEGREFTIAIAGRRALPAIEIVAPLGFFDYAAKYASPVSLHRFDADLLPTTAAALETAAISAAEALGTRGLVRVDLMLDRYGLPWVLEVNTIPGLTDHSLAPLAAARAGWSFAELCDWMVRDALGVEVTL